MVPKLNFFVLQETWYFEKFGTAEFMVFPNIAIVCIGVPASEPPNKAFLVLDLKFVFYIKLCVKLLLLA